MRAVRLALGSIVVASLAALAVAGAPQLARRGHAPSRTAILNALASRPLAFEANRGQTDPRAQFIAQGDGYTAYLTPKGTTIAVWRPQSPVRRPQPFGPLATRLPVPRPVQGTTFALAFLGAARAPVATPLDRQPLMTRYFHKGRTIAAPTFGRVAYSGVYPGIDLVYRGSQQHLEYDWVVRPGADPTAIRLAARGAETVSLLPRGGARIAGNGLSLVQPAPVVYQELGRGRQRIPGRFVLTGRHVLGFAVGSYDRSRPLIIDPTINVPGNFFGGAGNEGALGIASDPSDPTRFYIVGYTDQPSTFPNPNNGVGLIGGNTDIFAAHGYFDGSTLGLDALSIIGSPGIDFPTNVAVGPGGIVGIPFITNGTNFPVNNAFQPKFNGGYDGGVLVLDPTLRIRIATYDGGAGNDIAATLSFAQNGNVIVGGYTSSTNFPLLHPVQNTFGGIYDGTITTFDPNGQLLFSSFFGGPATDAFSGSAANGNTIFMAGGGHLPGAQNESPSVEYTTDGGLTWHKGLGIANPQGDTYVDGDGFMFGDNVFFPGVGAPAGVNLGGCSDAKVCQPGSIFQYDTQGNLIRTTPIFPPNNVGFLFPSALGVMPGPKPFGFLIVGDDYPKGLTNFENYNGWVQGLTLTPCPNDATHECATPKKFVSVNVPGLSFVDGILTPNGKAIVVGSASANVNVGSSGLTGTQHGGTDGVVVQVDVGVPPPCECSSITTKVSGAADFHSEGKGTAFSFTVDWFMECTKGAGGCEGAIDVVNPAGTDIKVSEPKAEIKCVGSCSTARALGTKGRFKVRGTSADSLDPDKRAGKSFTFHFKKFCIINGAKHAEGAGVFTVVYNSHGLVDRRKSDLNGNGKPDGTEKKGK